MYTLSIECYWVSELIDIGELQDHGEGLKRPECVLATQAGDLFVSNWDGGVSKISPNGQVIHFLAKNPAIDLKPNGIALEQSGSFLLANLGDDGGVWRLHKDLSLSPVLIELDGETIPPANFVLVDAQNRIWITVSTRKQPRADAYRNDIADGFLILIDEKGARIVADELGYTNECQIHPSGDWVYVNETFSRRLSRFRINADGTISSRETVCEFGEHIFPDGLCFDTEGALLVTSIVSNSVLRILPNGSVEMILKDGDPDHLGWVENAYLNHAMGRPHLDQVKSKKLQNISSLAFGGKDRKTAFLGCLLGDKVTSFQSDIAGVAPAHWAWRTPW